VVPSSFTPLLLLMLSWVFRPAISRCASWDHDRPSENWYYSDRRFLGKFLPSMGTHIWFWKI